MTRRLIVSTCQSLNVLERRGTIVDHEVTALIPKTCTVFSTFFLVLRIDLVCYLPGMQAFVIHCLKQDQEKQLCKRYSSVLQLVVKPSPSMERRSPDLALTLALRMSELL